MSRRIDHCELQVQQTPGAEWTSVTALSDAEWTGFAPAGCGVDQGRVIALPENAASALLDPNAPDQTWRLVDAEGEPLFEFLGYVDDRRPRARGRIVLGISTTPELLGAWTELQPTAVD
ncbi:MAG: hypothetical protein OXG27_15400 [Chloroflexi bacterium]|nr:hypothetical protein [Chloroflexota bacterium]